MVIDKTTGRGCALSIVSKTVTRKLIAEGIVGRAIYKKPHTKSKTGYVLLRVVDFQHEEGVYIMSGNEQNEEPTKGLLWAPSFVDKEAWERAASQFTNFGRLDQSVEKYLLPEMEEYLQSFSDTELASLTKHFLIEKGVINTPISQRRGKTYYFNEYEVYSLDRNSELFPHDGRLSLNFFAVRAETCFNMNLWRKAASRFEVGMTLDDCIRIFLQTDLTHNVPQEPSPIDRLVQYISPPVYERVPENSDESTFDYIRMTVGLPHYQFDSWEALQSEVKKYQDEIYQRVFQKLEKDRQFKKYGVSTNFLKLSDVMLLRDFSMEFIFELKEQKANCLT